MLWFSFFVGERIVGVPWRVWQVHAKFLVLFFRVGCTYEFDPLCLERRRRRIIGREIYGEKDVPNTYDFLVNPLCNLIILFIQS